MKNRFGLDTDYFEDKLSILLRDIDNYTPEEMARALTRLALVADGDVTRDTCDHEVAISCAYCGGAEKLGEITDGMKAEHWGEHYFTEWVEAYDYSDEDHERTLIVPWTTCKEIYQGMLKTALKQD